MDGISQSKEVTATIMPQGPHDVVLGCDVLMQFKLVTIDWEASQVIFGKQRAQAAGVQKRRFYHRQARAASTLKIPARTVVLLSALVSTELFGAGAFLFEPNKETENRLGIYCTWLTQWYR
jgi:hypothetical protein